MSDVPAIPRKHDPRWVPVQHAMTAVRREHGLRDDDEVRIDWLVEKLPWGTTTVENLVLGMTEVGLVETDVSDDDGGSELARPTVVRGPGR